ncbi:MAG: hypothetical protein ABIQ11_11075, partial [Saprospiraceae bacterium]
MIRYFRLILFSMLICWSNAYVFSQRPDQNPIGQNPIGSSQTIDTTEGVTPLDTPVPMSYVLL